MSVGSPPPTSQTLPGTVPSGSSSVEVTTRVKSSVSGPQRSSAVAVTNTFSTEAGMRPESGRTDTISSPVSRFFA